MLQHWKSSHAICPGSCLLAPFAACGISDVLEMMGLDPTPTHVIPQWENPRGCFSSELPATGMEFMEWELLFNMAKGDGILLLPSSSGCIPPIRSAPCVPPLWSSQLCWGFLETSLYSSYMEILLSWWMSLESDGEYGANRSRAGGGLGESSWGPDALGRRRQEGLCGRSGTRRVGSQHPGRTCQAGFRWCSSSSCSCPRARQKRPCQSGILYQLCDHTKSHLSIIPSAC